MTRRSATSNDRGSITLWFAIFGVVLFMIVGLVYDGGLRITGTREAINVAEEAARAGTQAVDGGAVYNQAGTAVIDPAQATARAQAFLAQRGWTGTVTATPNDVTVTATRTQQLVFSQLWGQTTATVTGRATARPVRGFAN